MAAHFQDADYRSLPFDRAYEMVADGAAPLFDSRRRKVFAGAEIMLYFIKDPWIPDRRTADHDAVNPITVAVKTCLFRGVDITVAEDRYMDTRIFLYPCDKRPVCL